MPIINIIFLIFLGKKKDSWSVFLRMKKGFCQNLQNLEWSR